MVVKRGREREVEAIFEKWDLHAVQHRRGHRRTARSRARARQLVVEIPNRALTDEAPVYHRPMARPEWLDEVRTLDLASLRPSADADARRCDAARLADHCEQALDLPAVRPHGAHEHHRAPRSGLRRRARKGHRPRAGDVGGRQRPFRLPRTPARARSWPSPKRRATSPAPARCRSPRPTISTSATPRGPRSCGSSPRPSLASARPAARSDMPITGGNVSLYNETDGKAILPTPVLGVVG